MARIRALRAASDDEFRLALDQVDTDLTTRIGELRATQQRLRQLADGQLLAIPAEDTDSEIPALIQGAVNASSPAWQRIDTLIRLHLDV